MKISRFYKGDIIRETNPTWGKWGISSLIAVIQDVEFENTTWTVHYRPLINHLKDCKLWRMLKRNKK